MSNVKPRIFHWTRWQFVCKSHFDHIYTEPVRQNVSHPMVSCFYACACMCCVNAFDYVLICDKAPFPQYKLKKSALDFFNKYSLYHYSILSILVLNLFYVICLFFKPPHLSIWYYSQLFCFLFYYFSNQCNSIYHFYLISVCCDLISTHFIFSIIQHGETVISERDREWEWYHSF